MTVRNSKDAQRDHGRAVTERVLDLGCGCGTTLQHWNLGPCDQITGMDINLRSLEIARQKYPERTFRQGSGESIPFEDQSFDRVICALSLPYMNIPKALAEIHRVLVPNGMVSLSLHPPGFTLAELRKSFPKPKATLYRLYVLLNGGLFHLSGWAPGESFQTERGMRLALKRLGFSITKTWHGKGPAGPRFILEARK